jgi:diguanylate cyclase (GGDEF)-like protein/PAS domain S-box-containing protein
MDSMKDAMGSSGEAPYRTLVEASSAVVICLIDARGEITYINRACREVLGYEPEEMLGRRLGDFIRSEQLSSAIENLAAAGQPGGHFRQRVSARRRNGAGIHLWLDATPVTDREGGMRGALVIAHDLPDEVARESFPPATEAQGGERELAERLPAITYVAEPGPAGRWRYVSARIEKMLGYSQAEWLADPELWARSIHPKDRARVVAEEERDVASGDAVRSEYRMVARDGHVLWVIDEAVLRLDPDGSPRYDGLLIDITEHKRLESQLQFLAEHDPLTGLCNRRRFVEELTAEVKRLRRQPQPASLLMLDIDNLKAVNDSLGHRAGDRLIRATAEALSRRMRETDTVARLGGDEFAVLLRGTGGETAEHLAVKLLDGVRGRLRVLAKDGIDAAVSAGLADLRPEVDSPNDTLAAADLAMYEAKRRGGDRVETYSRALRRRA